ncbi:MAG: SIMPL domain-containing protein [Pseudomonadota bacterium]
MKLYGTAVFAASLLAAPALADAQTTAQPILNGTRLEISVRGEVKRVPDVAVISTGVITQSVDAATVMRDNAARMARVLTALKRAGVADKDVTTSAVNLSPQYRYNNNQPPVITGYQANNQVTVRFRDITRSGAILDALVKEGSNEINGPSLTIDKPEAAMDEARIAAISVGRARAEIYAGAAGMKIKRIVSISENEGMSVVPRPMMAMMAKSAEADTVIMPGEQALGVTVTMVFELQ